MSGSVVPVHPEATETAEVLRWVFPAGTLGFVGEPAGIPAPLQELYAAGVLAGAPVVQPSAVLLRIGAGHGWRVDGPAVRRALQTALATPEGWQPPADATGDDVLRAAIDEVLAGEVGDFVRGHGGVIDVRSVVDGEVTIELGGACSGCPASGVTVQNRFEAALRQRCPSLRTVIAHELPRSRRSRLIQLLPTRS